MVLVSLDDASRLMKNSEALSLFIGIVSCFGGLGSFATIHSLTEIQPQVSLVLLLSGILLVISGLYNTVSVISRIRDPFLFNFYGKINFLKDQEAGDDFSVYLALGSILLFSGFLWTFLYSANFNDALIAAFGMCLILPVTTLAIRIHIRLNIYRCAYLYGNDASDSYVLQDEQLVLDEYVLSDEEPIKLES